MSTVAAWGRRASQLELTYPRAVNSQACHSCIMILLSTMSTLGGMYSIILLLLNGDLGLSFPLLQ
mgnify:CR=1 FL=1